MYNYLYIHIYKRNTDSRHETLCNSRQHTATLCNTPDEVHLKCWRQNAENPICVTSIDTRLSRTSACCSVLQCGAVCCSLLQCVTECYRICYMLQRVAVCCSVLQCVAVCFSMSQCVTECYSVLQYVAAFCSVLQSTLRVPHRLINVYQVQLRVCCVCMCM